MLGWVQRAALALGGATILVAGLLAAGTTPVAAAGAPNWESAFTGTSTIPIGTIGVHGWCAFGGGTAFNAQGEATRGTSGGCEYVEYLHAPSGAGFTCDESITVTAWYIGKGKVYEDLFFSGTDAVNPSGLTGVCVVVEGVTSPSFTDLDSTIPAVPGHYDVPGYDGYEATQMQVTALP